MGTTLLYGLKALVVLVVFGASAVLSENEHPVLAVFASAVASGIALFIALVVLGGITRWLIGG